MRLRIQTLSPLPELKAWFIPEIQDTQESVSDLKDLICKGIPQLRAKQIRAQSLTLLLDGFELLNDSPISAVRDGDLIVVKMVQRMKESIDVNSTLPSQSRKRKRDSNEYDRSPKKKHARSTASRQVFSTHRVVSQESSSDSESTTSDSESSTSSLSSTSSSTSSSSSGSLPTILSANTSKAPQLGTHQLAKEQAVKQPSKTTHVPPGRGKPSTHSRNQRRKKKRECEKLGKAGILNQPNGGMSEANKLPVGTNPSSSLPQSSNETNVASCSTQDIPPVINSVEREPSSSSKYVYITSDQVMMGSLRNKSKKKGYKQSMTGHIPRKVVFSDGADQERLSESLDDRAPQNKADNQFSEANKSSYRLIPPSELQDLGQLPSNVFVTSVDVEKHIWQKWGKRGKPVYHESDYEEGWEQGGDQAYIEELPYGDGPQAEAVVSGTSNDIDWDRAEKLWEASSLIQDIQQLSDGMVFGWKELAINPRTFTPEMLLFLARVVKVTPEGIDRNISNVEIVFRQLRRPGASEAAVAFGVAAAGSEEAEDDDMGGEECVAWSDVLAGQWRIVDM